MKPLAELLRRPVSTILCLGAHGDDIEIGCGGTVLKLLERNPALHVHWVVLSAEGGRRDEVLRSAGTLLAGAGSQDIQVCDFEDRYFPAQASEIKRVFDRVGRSLSPELVFTHFREDLHQDHRLVSELTWNTFRDHLILEYEIPKWDADLTAPNVYVPLPEDVVARKVELLLEHFPTQRGKHWFTDDLFRGLMRLRGMEANSPTRFAEAFRCRKLVLAG